MRNFIYLLLLAIVVSSCGTSKLKQQIKAHNYFNQHPNELAELCGTKFPPETKYIPGKTIVTPGDTVTVRDTVSVTVDCPDGTQVTADCPPNEKQSIRDTIFRVDTITVANTALISSLNYTISSQQARIDIQDAQNKELAAEIKKQSRQIAGMGIGIIVGILVFVFFIFKRK